MKKHECPYLENHNKCTHKSKKYYSRGSKPICGYLNPLKCELLNESKSLLRNALIAIGKPFGLGVSQ